MNKPEHLHATFDQYPTETLLYITNRPPLVFTEAQTRCDADIALLF
jgi:hypothetical protein